MRTRTIGLLSAAAMTLAACGSATDLGIPEDPDAPVLQVRSEGGFAPVEFVLGRGPTYTLLTDGRLLYEGPSIAIYPGPLVPQYQIAQIDEDQMSSVLALVEEIGLLDMEDERDEEHGRNVADATTEIVTYWDDAGEHRYSVYALGIEPNPKNPATRSFADLLVLLDELAATAEDVGSLEPDRVQIVMGVGFVNTDFDDVRDWPLEETDLSDWETLPNQWMCKVHDAEVLDAFADATQATQWTHPDPMMDAPSYTLLVRPLHPGEPDCFGS